MVGITVVGNWSSYQAWMWKRKMDAGLDLIPYCGQGSDNRSLLHNLGQTPEMIWVKNMTGSGYPVSGFIIKIWWNNP